MSSRKKEWVYYVNRFNKITWWEIGLLALIATITMYHDFNQIPKQYAECGDGSKVLITNETKEACGFPGLRDQFTGKIYIDMYPREYIRNEHLYNQIKQSIQNGSNNIENNNNDSICSNSSTWNIMHECIFFQR